MFKKLLKNVQVVAVVCNQWGDTGKGKFSDLLSSSWADVIARGTGGNNAGHTVVVGGKERIFHLLPAGITQDKKGKISILGNGMVIDLKILVDELKELEAEKLSYNNLMISKDAHVVMPYHIIRDQAKHQSQKKGGIGSTGRGIGPCYEDKIARRGIRIEDLLNKKSLIKKINKAAEYYPEQKIKPEKIITELRPYIRKIKPFIKDTFNEVPKLLKQGKKILLEGAQGLLLSVEYGTYPYVTSSDCSVNGTAAGIGISAHDIDLVLGIIKFPFMTRVGAGPFPTEIGGLDSEKYCGEDGHIKEDELRAYKIPYTKEAGKIKYDWQDSKIVKMLNSNNPLMQSVGMRLSAGEYGATTGRPRRVGWTDAVAGHFARNINGPKIILTKVDSLAGAKSFKIAYGYKDDSKNGGKKTERFNRDLDFLRNVKPVYKKYKGYKNLEGIKQYKKLPLSLRQAIKDFEKFTNGEVVAVSIGPNRDETIVVD